MHIADIIQLIQGNWVPFAAGFAAAHTAWVVGIVFNAILKVPVIRAAIISNPARAKSLIDQISKEIEDEIDKAAESKS